MLAREAGAAMVFFDLFDVNAGLGRMLPADLDSLLPPPAGSPGIFAGWTMTRSVSGRASATPSASGSSTSTGRTPPTRLRARRPANQQLPVDAFDADMCGFSRLSTSPETDQGLDAISDRLMFRLQYRNFGTHQTLVTNHTVDASGTDLAGVRWYELHGDLDAGALAIQQGTCPDGDHRWMASAARCLGRPADRLQRLLRRPSRRGRRPAQDDPPGTLPQPEVELIAGTGSQTFFDGRWGDYSMMAIDPLDECTFWFTSEYLVETSVADWHTRVGALKFPSCTTGPRGSVEGTVTKVADGEPLAGAMVEVGDATTFTDGSGHYRITVPVGTYDLAASAYGFRRVVVEDVDVAEDATVTQDFSLESLPEVLVSGTVRDGSGHGCHSTPGSTSVAAIPVAAIHRPPDRRVPGHPVPETPPFRVRAMTPGYLTESRIVEETTDTATEDFSLIMTPSPAPRWVTRR
jgi:hypothetical protein